MFGPLQYRVAEMEADNPLTTRVLIAEDNTDMCELIEVMLGDLETHCAWTVADAWRMFNSANFSIAVLDYHLPDGKAFSLCELIRSHGSRVPIIIITSDPDILSDDVHRAGAQLLLQKSSPTFFDDLVSEVHQLSAGGLARGV
jgi:DNA-binding response OmpR family regulator